MNLQGKILSGKKKISIVHNFIYMAFLKRQHYTNGDQISGGQRLVTTGVWVMKVGVVIRGEPLGFFRGLRLFHILTASMLIP